MRVGVEEPELRCGEQEPSPSEEGDTERRWKRDFGTLTELYDDIGPGREDGTAGSDKQPVVESRFVLDG